jgi:hypothetical protein
VPINAGTDEILVELLEPEAASRVAPGTTSGGDFNGIGDFASVAVCGVADEADRHTALCRPKEIIFGIDREWGLTAPRGSHDV